MRFPRWTEYARSHGQHRRKRVEKRVGVARGREKFLIGVLRAQWARPQRGKHDVKLTVTHGARAAVRRSFVLRGREVTVTLNRCTHSNYRYVHDGTRGFTQSAITSARVKVRGRACATVNVSRSTASCWTRPHTPRQMLRRTSHRRPIRWRAGSVRSCTPTGARPELNCIVTLGTDRTAEPNPVPVVLHSDGVFTRARVALSRRRMRPECRVGCPRGRRKWRFSTGFYAVRATASAQQNAVVYYAVTFVVVPIWGDCARDTSPRLLRRLRNFYFLFFSTPRR